MKHYIFLTSILCALICASCNDDPRLVEKHEKQRAEIARLKGEIALIEEKLKNIPANVSVDLEAARKVAEKQRSEIEQLEAEVVELRVRKQAMQSEFDAYRAKYQVK